MTDWTPTHGNDPPPDGVVVEAKMHSGRVLDMVRTDGHWRLVGWNTNFHAPLAWRVKEELR